MVSPLGIPPYKLQKLKTIFPLITWLGTNLQMGPTPTQPIQIYKLSRYEIGFANSSVWRETVSVAENIRTRQEGSES